MSLPPIFISLNTAFGVSCCSTALGCFMSLILALAHAQGQSGVSTRATAISSHGGWVNGFA